MLIEVAGIDGSGQTTIAMNIASTLGINYEHGPWFSSEEADKLNYVKHNSNIREFMFMQDRILNKNKLPSIKKVAIDGYIFRGLAYCYTFSKDLYQFAFDAYINSGEFRIPELFIMIDSDYSTLEYVLKVLRKDPNADKVLSNYDVLKEGLYNVKRDINTAVDSKIITINNTLNTFDVTVKTALDAVHNTFK